jgi:hypothetical protein
VLLLLLPFPLLLLLVLLSPRTHLIDSTQVLGCDPLQWAVEMISAAIAGPFEHLAREHHCHQCL